MEDEGWAILNKSSCWQFLMGRDKHYHNIAEWDFENSRNFSQEKIRDNSSTTSSLRFLLNMVGYTCQIREGKPQNILHAEGGVK